MVVRESITQFAQQKNTLRGGRVKLLILDEADKLSSIHQTIFFLPIRQD